MLNNEWEGQGRGAGRKKKLFATADGPSRWSRGRVEVLENVRTDNLIFAEEGKGIVKKVSLPPG